MEFPKTGKQCNVKYCKLLEFLPVKCAHCQLEFCKDHSDTTSHECTKYKDNFITEKKVGDIILLSAYSSKLVEIIMFKNYHV